MPYDVEQVWHLVETTIAYYDRFARAFWEGTRHHDVTQNYAAFLNAIESDPSYSILDLGCGPGRDLSHFRSLGQEAVGLDGSQQFVAMAQAYSGCEVLHQDLLAMRLPESSFDGIFANASPGSTESVLPRSTEPSRCYFWRRELQLDDLSAIFPTIGAPSS
jgi:SAM-dependent methyltransferase